MERVCERDTERECVWQKLRERERVVCVKEKLRERERERERERVSVGEGQRQCVCEWTRNWERERVCVCVFVCKTEGERKCERAGVNEKKTCGAWVNSPRGMPESSSHSNGRSHTHRRRKKDRQTDRHDTWHHMFNSSCVMPCFPSEHTCLSFCRTHSWLPGTMAVPPYPCHVMYVCMYMNICIHIYDVIWDGALLLWSLIKATMLARMYIYIYIHTQTNPQTGSCSHPCIYICTYILRHTEPSSIPAPSRWEPTAAPRPASGRH
jgi:hypothetical protein